MTLIGWDIDGVITAGSQPNSGAIIISGRTFAEYDDTVKQLSQHFPVYIRGIGKYGDHLHAALFKASIINMFGVTEFHEDHPVQVVIIRMLCPNTTVITHGRAEEEHL